MTNTPDVFARLLGSVRDHLGAFSTGADIASVFVGSDSVDGEYAVVQLRAGQLAGLAAGLLGWADTITGVTAEAWRPPTGVSVHLTVTGRLLHDSTPVKVYGGVPYTADVFGPDLQPDGRQSLGLSVLRGWASGAAVAA
jgi:hypothetical protein